jgi:hypothetical protein
MSQRDTLLELTYVAACRRRCVREGKGSRLGKRRVIDLTANGIFRRYDI